MKNYITTLVYKKNSFWTGKVKAKVAVFAMVTDKYLIFLGIAGRATAKSFYAFTFGMVSSADKKSADNMIESLYYGVGEKDEGFHLVEEKIPAKFIMSKLNIQTQQFELKGVIGKSNIFSKKIFIYPDAYGYEDDFIMEAELNIDADGINPTQAKMEKKKRRAFFKSFVRNKGIKNIRMK